MLPPCVIVFGPTASGKSGLALNTLTSLDKKPSSFMGFGGIFNGDSEQIYKELPILTAAPSKTEQEMWPHVFYNHSSYLSKIHYTLAQDEQYAATIKQSSLAPSLYNNLCAYKWAQEALDFLKSCQNKGKIGWIVGGTGFYIQALLKNLSPLPEISSEKAAYWTNFYRDTSTQNMHTLLHKIDPILGKKLHPNDRKRIQRGLIVFHATQVPLSQWHQQSPPTMQVNPYIICLEGSQSYLDRRIQKRLHLMWSGGVLEEVEALSQHFPPFLIKKLQNLSLWHHNNPMEKTQSTQRKNLPASWNILHKILLCLPIGFLECFQYIHHTISKEEALRAIFTKTRHYAKSQKTWIHHTIKPHLRLPYGSTTLFQPEIERITQQLSPSSQLSHH